MSADLVVLSLLRTDVECWVRDTLHALIEMDESCYGRQEASQVNCYVRLLDEAWRQLGTQAVERIVADVNCWYKLRCQDDRADLQELVRRMFELVREEHEEAAADAARASH